MKKAKFGPFGKSSLSRKELLIKQKNRGGEEGYKTRWHLLAFPTITNSVLDYKMLQGGQMLFGWIHQDWFDGEIKINYVLQLVSFWPGFMCQN